MLIKYLPIIPTLIMVALMACNAPSIIPSEQDKSRLHERGIQKAAKDGLAA